MKEFYIYHNYIPKVGGIETAVYNLAKTLDREGIKVTVLYSSAESQNTVFKYAQVANIIKLTPDLNIKVDLLLLASNHDVPKGVQAERYLQWVHSDYNRYTLKLKNTGLHDNGRLKYVAVSKHAAKVIKEREGIDCEVIYNFVDPDFGKDDRPVLKLVTNSRVSPEKGFGRMLQFAELLRENDIRFLWTIYGDNSHIVKEFTDWKDRFAHIGEVNFVGFKEEVEIGLTNVDYLVQLSDFEGCPLAVLEALEMKVPCLVTNWLGIEEIIKDGKNGYILPMEMNNIDLDKIVNEIPKVRAKKLSGAEDWIKLING